MNPHFVRNSPMLSGPRATQPSPIAPEQKGYDGATQDHCAGGHWNEELVGEPALLSAQNLSVTFGGNRVLEDIDLIVPRGRILTIIGPNGSGKSTLLRALIGAVRPSAGEIQRAAHLRIGYVPQRLQLDPNLPLSVERFLSLPRVVSRPAKQQALADAGVAGLEARQLATLSGGQFQRVLLARALVSKPDILMLDEAAQGLDHQGTAAFYQRIDQIRNELGCAVLMVSHELHLAVASSDEVICLNRRIQCAGAPDKIVSEPAYQAMVGNVPPDALSLRHRGHGIAQD